ncbi:hypothetical protein WH47_11053 [Habropoda laboriosa]|uniref:Histone-lysine N-methyltransferase SETMAR n=1 Tax=Habropoda laboriosa TaxID=597456 RepID=A0A0L7QLJ9_9HYME|nr:hypothetical protein WH47_11053 [Habropoda laboriosa]
MQFYQFFLQQIDDQNFLRKILWTDECTFTNNRMFNRRSKYTSVLEEIRNQMRFSINVWCGILDTIIIDRPYFFTNSILNDERYRYLLEFILPNLIYHVSLRTPLNLKYYQQDGAPAHNACNVYLRRIYCEKWFRTRSATPWSSLSSDLTPLDFFFYGITSRIKCAHVHLFR